MKELGDGERAPTDLLSFDFFGILNGFLAFLNFGLLPLSLKLIPGDAPSFSLELFRVLCSSLGGGEGLLLGSLS